MKTRNRTPRAAALSAQKPEHESKQFRSSNPRRTIARIAGFLALMFAGLVAAQTPAPWPNPYLNSGGSVLAVARLPGGGMVVGGDFSEVNGTRRSNIAKILADGSVDPNWNPSADDSVTALAVDAGGNVYASGWFGNIGGQSRKYIAKLSGTGSGTADANWNPSPDDWVTALAVDAGGNVYAGGQFSSIGGQSRSYIAKLSGTGSGAADANWNPSPDNRLTALALDAGGNVYAGGYFSSIGGQSRSYIAKLSGTGSGAADANWNASASDAVDALAVDASGNVYAGGNFGSIGGQSRSQIAKLSGTGSGAADASWNPSASGSVFALAVDAGGNVYAGGAFTQIGGQSRSHIAKLSGTGSGAVDANWNPLADDWLFALALDASGNVYAGGYFAHIGGQAHPGLAVLPPDASAPTQPAATTTTLGASPTSATPGQTVHFTATVAATAIQQANPRAQAPASPGGNAVAAVAPSGSVTFLDGASAIGSAPLDGATATFASASLALGTHSVTAQYSGDASYAASTGGPVSVVIAAAPAVSAPSVAAPMLAPAWLIALAIALALFALRRVLQNRA
ncbi:MAG: Ig-like domain repeat protein [Rudaea sp.]|uniref:Ig-like domain repeat protein n=1 Tax=Rudaea sp. TaxID=2136325 RepID=UPI0039E362E7